MKINLRYRYKSIYITMEALFASVSNRATNECDASSKALLFDKE